MVESKKNHKNESQCYKHLFSLLTLMQNKLVRLLLKNILTLQGVLHNQHALDSAKNIWKTI